MRKLLCKTRSIIHQQRTAFSEISKFRNNFLSATNISFIETMYEKWTKDKNSVSPSFNAFFELLEKG